MLVPKYPSKAMILDLNCITRLLDVASIKLLSRSTQPLQYSRSRTTLCFAHLDTRIVQITNLNLNALCLAHYSLGITPVVLNAASNVAYFPLMCIAQHPCLPCLLPPHFIPHQLCFRLCQIPIVMNEDQITKAKD